MKFFTGQLGLQPFSRVKAYTGRQGINFPFGMLGRRGICQEKRKKGQAAKDAYRLSVGSKTPSKKASETDRAIERQISCK